MSPVSTSTGVFNIYKQATYSHYKEPMNRLWLKDILHKIEISNFHENNKYASPGWVRRLVP